MNASISMNEKQTQVIPMSEDKNSASPVVPTSTTPGTLIASNVSTVVHQHEYQQNPPKAKVTKGTPGGFGAVEFEFNPMNLEEARAIMSNSVTIFEEAMEAYVKVCEKNPGPAKPSKELK